VSQLHVGWSIALAVDQRIQFSSSQWTNVVLSPDYLCWKAGWAGLSCVVAGDVTCKPNHQLCDAVGVSRAHNAAVPRLDASFGKLCVLDCQFANLSPSSDGGAIYTRGRSGETFVDSSAFVTCSAANYRGGAICVANCRSLVLTANCLQSCSALRGGGLWVSDPEAGALGGVGAFLPLAVQGVDVKNQNLASCSAGEIGGGIQWEAGAVMSEVNFTGCHTVAVAARAGSSFSFERVLGKSQAVHHLLMRGGDPEGANSRAVRCWLSSAINFEESHMSALIFVDQTDFCFRILQHTVWVWDSLFVGCASRGDQSRAQA
jgi:hypothetical protein